ncbi:hypothetical protein QTN25_008934 [Entamoeba marina]
MEKRVVQVCCLLDAIMKENTVKSYFIEILLDLLEVVEDQTTVLQILDSYFLCSPCHNIYKKQTIPILLSDLHSLRALDVATDIFPILNCWGRIGLYSNELKCSDKRVILSTLPWVHGLTNVVEVKTPMNYDKDKFKQIINTKNNDVEMKLVEGSSRIFRVRFTSHLYAKPVLIELKKLFENNNDSYVKFAPENFMDPHYFNEYSGFFSLPRNRVPRNVKINEKEGSYIVVSENLDSFKRNVSRRSYEDYSRDNLRRDDVNNYRQDYYRDDVNNYRQDYHRDNSTNYYRSFDQNPYQSPYRNQNRDYHYTEDNASLRGRRMYEEDRREENRREERRRSQSRRRSYYSRGR